MSTEKSKFRLEQEAGKFSETPSDFNPFSEHQITDKQTRSLYDALGFENPVTPERKKRLEKISNAISQSLRRYGLDEKPHNPELIYWDPVFYMDDVSDPWGALYATKRGQVHIRMFLPAITTQRSGFEKRIKDEAIGYIYTHELVHLSSVRTRILEEQEDQNKERLSRIGLFFEKNGTGLWRWVNEGMTDDLTKEEYPKIENYPRFENPGYDFYIKHFNAMTEALAVKNGQDPQAVKEVFRSSALGSGTLWPLRKVINPPFKSLFEFIKVTDAPMNFSFSMEGMEKVLNKLWEEVRLGQTGTHLQNELKKLEEDLLANQRLILEAGKSYDPENKVEFKNNMRKVIEKCPGLDWLLGEDWVAASKFMEEGEENLKYAKVARKLLASCFAKLPLLVLMSNNPEIKNLTKNKKISDINLDEMESLYLKGLGIEQKTSV